MELKWGVECEFMMTECGLCMWCGLVLIFFSFPFLLTLNNLFYYFLLYVLIFKHDCFYNINNFNYIFFFIFLT